MPPVVPPTTYPNLRKDNPWDNDAVSWLLEHDDVAKHFKRTDLFECARRQPQRLAEDLDRVILAAQLCDRHGVEQLQVFDRNRGKTVWRLRRTDPGAPKYPDYGADAPASRMVIEDADRAAAERLILLLPAYEAELREAGKSKNTVFTYVDRAERFLRRIRS